MHKIFFLSQIPYFWPKNSLFFLNLENVIKTFISVEMTFLRLIFVESCFCGKVCVILSNMGDMYMQDLRKKMLDSLKLTLSLILPWCETDQKQYKNKRTGYPQRNRNHPRVQPARGVLHFVGRLCRRLVGQFGRRSEMKKKSQVLEKAED